MSAHIRAYIFKNSSSLNMLPACSPENIGTKSKVGKRLGLRKTSPFRNRKLTISKLNYKCMPLIMDKSKFNKYAHMF